MEIRNGNIIVGAAGGTAGKNSKTYRVSLPSSWLSEMEIGEDEKEICLLFDGSRISIQKRLPFEDFIESRFRQKHMLKLISYYNNNTLCTRICADLTDKMLAVKNEDVPNLHRAFGVNEAPSWDDFEEFLESRCVPRRRDGIRYYLEALGLDEYDPFEIVLRTGGKMAEDHQWLKMEDIS